jgi:hypothetical protein
MRYIVVLDARPTVEECIEVTLHRLLTTLDVEITCARVSILILTSLIVLSLHICEELSYILVRSTVTRPTTVDTSDVDSAVVT